MSLLDLMPGGGTFVPNCLLDVLLPQLRDTELRVLLVVCRQTVGRRGPGGQRRESDWISQRQLIRRTGRASEAVSRAIDALVKRGLLIVQDPDGRVLLSPHERRSSRSRLYYCLSPRVLKLDTLPGTSSESEVAKANTTKENLYIKKDMNKGHSRSPTGWLRASAVARPDPGALDRRPGRG